jgi:hypothetical protein
VLDDVEGRRFAVDPAGERSPPLVVAALDVELDERSGELLALPRRGGFAGAKTNDRVPHPDRLPRPHRQVADDPVALVEQADDRDPLGHWRDSGLGSGEHSLGARLLRLPLRRLIAPAARQNERERNHRRHRSHHVYSGIQGW